MLSLHVTRTMGMVGVFLLLVVAPLAPASRILSPAKTVTLSNSEPRLDTAGEIVDCHSGNFVHFQVKATACSFAAWCNAA